MNFRRIKSRWSFTAFAVMLAGVAHAEGTSPTWAAMSEPEPQDVFKVVQYLDLSKDGNLVVISAGRDAGVVVGSIFKSYRPTSPTAVASADHSMWIETGRLKAVDVQSDFTIASVEQFGSPMAKAFFPKFPGVMAGDLATIQRISLARRQVVVPALTLSYFGLFEDPKAMPQSFELRRQGVEKLREAAKQFADARVSMLMVEGYTDRNGSAAINQVESYQRAMTVRQFLIDELGFDETRVLAVGYGEAEPVDAGSAPGYVEANRRIVLKAVTMPAAH